MTRAMRDSDQTTLFHWIGLFGIALLIVLGTAIGICTLIAFCLAALQIVFGDEEYSWKMLFLLIPFSTIFKLSPGSTSLFTYILLLFVVILFQRQQTFPSIWLFFAIYMLAIPVLKMQLSDFNILRWIKLLCGLLLIYYYFDDRASHDEAGIFLAFVIGIIGASLTRHLNSAFFRIERYLDDADTVGDGGAEYSDLTRFTGLCNDPNYYTVNLIIAMCLLIILMYKKKISFPLYLGLTAPLIFFDIATYSKSAMLMLAIPVGSLLYATIVSNRKSLKLLVVLMAVAVITYLVASGGGAFKIVLSRFGSGTDNLDKLTTGRTKIWRYNLEFFKNNPGWLIVGLGINAAYINGWAHHNTYIEMPYHLGLIGVSLLFGILKQISNGISHPLKRNILNYSVLTCVLIMYMFLSMLFFYDMPFQMILVFIVLNMNLEPTSVSAEM